MCAVNQLGLSFAVAPEPKTSLALYYNLACHRIHKHYLTYHLVCVYRHEAASAFCLPICLTTFMGESLCLELHLQHQLDLDHMEEVMNLQTSKKRGVSVTEDLLQLRDSQKSCRYLIVDI